MKNLLIVLGLMLLLGQTAYATSSASDTVSEFTDKLGDITSSSTSDDKTEVRQLVIEAENYYANPALPMGVELAKSVDQLKRNQPGISTDEAVDSIYKNIR